MLPIYLFSSLFGIGVSAFAALKKNRINDRSIEIQYGGAGTNKRKADAYL